MQVTAELVELYQNGALGWVAYMALNPKYGGQADTARDGLDPVQIRGAIERRMASRKFYLPPSARTLDDKLAAIIAFGVFEEDGAG